MNNIYYCKRMRMLQFMKDKGLLPIATRPDKDNPKFNVWLFDWDETFNNALTEYWSTRISK